MPHTILPTPCGSTIGGLPTSQFNRRSSTRNVIEAVQLVNAHPLALQGENGVDVQLADVSHRRRVRNRPHRRFSVGSPCAATWRVNLCHDAPEACDGRHQMVFSVVIRTRGLLQGTVVDCRPAAPKLMILPLLGRINRRARGTVARWLESAGRYAARFNDRTLKGLLAEK